MRRLSQLALVALCLAPLDARAESAGEFWEALSKVQTNRLKSIGHVVEKLRSNGIEQVIPPGCLTCPVYAIEAVKDDKTGKVLSRRKRPLSPTEVALVAGVAGDMLSTFAAAYAKASLATHMVINAGMNDVCSGGAPSKLCKAWGLKNKLGSDKVWGDPTEMFFDGFRFLGNAAMVFPEAQQRLAQGEDQAKRDENRSRSIADHLEATGTEELNGHSTVALTTPDLNLPLETNGELQLVLNRAKIWIEPEMVVVAGHRIEGTMIAGGQSRGFFVEIHNVDFRNPPGCGELIEPYKRIVRMGGILDEAQMAQIRQANEQLSELETKLAEMPAEQRSMMQSMLGDQMETLRGMADDGTLEHIQETEEILCDPDFEELFSGWTGAGAFAQGVDLAQIQRHLEILGYEPGNTDGVLDSMTRVAISWFQAEHAMVVTGEPSPPLARALLEEVQRQRT